MLNLQLKKVRKTCIYTRDVVHHHWYFNKQQAGTGAVQLHLVGLHHHVVHDFKLGLTLMPLAMKLTWKMLWTSMNVWF